MEKLRIKHRDFEIIEKIDDSHYKATYKKKLYYVEQYEIKSAAFNNKVYAYNRIYSSGIPSPKRKYIDKKAGYIVSEFIDGPTVMDLLLEKDLDEHIYETIFSTAWMGKQNKIVVNFMPDLWIYKDEQLFYMGSTFEDYVDKKDFAKEGIRYWFFTHEFINYVQEKGHKADKKRLKDSYVLNKEIVLTACKFYR